MGPGVKEMPRSNCIRVMVADDHRVVRSSLRFSMLAFDDLELVAEVESGEEALGACRQLDGSAAMPEVILMDMVMPEAGGTAATRAILEEFPQVRILILTGFDTSSMIQEALDAGAVGYLLKNATIDELADAIRAAHAGQTTLAPEVVKALQGTNTLQTRGKDWP
jgi:NarL family two-component system response regulator LiaR